MGYIIKVYQRSGIYNAIIGSDLLEKSYINKRKAEEKMDILEVIKNTLKSLQKKFFEDDDEIRYQLKLIDSSIFYIAGAQTLPPPLSQEEEMEILQEIEAGCEEKRKILVERNLRLVVYIAKKFENTGIGIEDLISIGTIGLMKAINTFNISKNIKLATYASRCIENEILMFLRKSNKIKTEVSIDEPLNQDCDGNELLLSDLLGTDPDVTSRRLEDEVDLKLLRVALSKLTSREKYLMELRFGINSDQKEKTQKEVADMLGISQSYISRLEKKIIEKMKRDIMSKTG